MNISSIKFGLLACVLALSACTKEVHHYHQATPEQNGQMTVYRTVQPDNTLLWWYLLSSNNHSYYYHSSTYIPSSSYASLPMTSVPKGQGLPPEVEQAKELGELVETVAVPPSEEPAVTEAEISADRIAEMQAEEAAEIAAEQHADEAAPAQEVSPSSETSSTESSPSESSSTSSDSSSSDSGSSSSSSD